ncbi:MAG: cysteine desulfurase [Thermaerobacterales bacterium]
MDLRQRRPDFPILERRVHGKPLVYLDNAATSQKPEPVLQALDRYYRSYNANVHRSVHLLAEEATLAYEEARSKLARFVNAARSEEIIFTRGTTEAINLVAYSWGRANIGAGDEILFSEMEHHSNMVPWHLLAKEKGARLRYIPVDGHGRLALDDIDSLITERTKLVALTQVSNVLGTINPVKDIARLAHQRGARILIDAAQSAPHMPVDVQDLGVDFLAFSGHKMCGPTGSGVLWGRWELLANMPPFHGGGEMIKKVRIYESTYAAPPARFEAGTPLIAQAIGLGAAADYLTEIGLDRIAAHERSLAKQAYEKLSEVDGLQIYGPPPGERMGAVAFNLSDVHSHDLASIVDQDGVAIRAGHHCCMPLHDKLGLAATARASFYLYNVPEEIDVLVKALYAAKKVFQI